MASRRMRGTGRGGRVKTGCSSSANFLLKAGLRFILRRAAGRKSFWSSSLSMREPRYAARRSRFSAFVIRRIATDAAAEASERSPGSRSGPRSQRPWSCWTARSMPSCMEAIAPPGRRRLWACSAGSALLEGCLRIASPTCRRRFRSVPRKGTANFMRPLPHRACMSTPGVAAPAATPAPPAAAGEVDAAALRGSRRRRSASASASVYGAKATAGAMLPGDSRSARTPRQLRCSRLIATTAICSPRCSTIGRERSRSRTPGPSRCSSWAWSRTIWTFTDLPWRSKLSSPCVCPRLSRGSRRAASRRSSVRSCLPSGSLCWSSLGASFPSALSASRAATRRPSASLACSSPTDEKQKQLRRTWRIPRAFMYPNVTSVLPVPAEPQTWSVAEVGGFEAPSPRSDQRRRTCEARAGPQRRSRGSRRWREAAGAPQASSSAWKAASSAAEAGGSSARTTGSVLVGALTTAAFAPAAFAPSAFGPSGLRSASFRRAISWTLLP
mmetsp:Transcript_1769/g.3509  ORF Transcript_1769/g.3509 Transcript_1769/m.3509 type:complete len:498 (+) Transcript_1769:357-1850(+)